jgi:hypothetical protein
MAVRINEMNDAHYKAFKVIFDLAMLALEAEAERIQEARANCEIPRIAPAKLESFTRAMLNIQKGQRVTLGVDEKEAAESIIELILPDYKTEISQMIERGEIPKARTDEELRIIETEAKNPKK